MFSASAGVLTRVFTAVDALRVVVEWSDAFPRDRHGRQLDNQRIPRSPLQVPAPAGAAPPVAARFQQSPEVVKSGVAMTEMSKVEV